MGRWWVLSVAKVEINGDSQVCLITTPNIGEQVLPLSSLLAPPAVLQGTEQAAESHLLPSTA